MTITTYTFWLRVAAVMQLITALIHSLSLFVKPEPASDIERQIFIMVESYRFDLGGGFHQPLGDLMTGLSMCFCLFFLLGGSVSLFLLRKRAAPDLISGIVDIYIVAYGFCFVWMMLFTFLPPIVLSGTVFLALVITRFAIFRKGVLKGEA